MVRSYIVVHAAATATAFVVRACSAEEALAAVGRTRADASVAPWEPALNPRHRLSEGGINRADVTLHPVPHMYPWDVEAARGFPEIPWQEGNLVVVKFSNGSLPRGRVLKAQTSNGSVRVQGHKGWICDFAAEMIELL